GRQDGRTEPDDETNEAGHPSNNYGHPAETRVPHRRPGAGELIQASWAPHRGANGCSTVRQTRAADEVENQLPTLARSEALESGSDLRCCLLPKSRGSVAN